MTSTLQQKIFADYWFRFDRYEIKGGYIRPAPGAKLSQYEPWRTFGAPKGKIGIKQPYEPLLALAKLLDPDPSDVGSVRAAENADHLILEWCSQNGLLGILLHRVEGVV